MTRSGLSYLLSERLNNAEVFEFTSNSLLDWRNIWRHRWWPSLTHHNGWSFTWARNNILLDEAWHQPLRQGSIAIVSERFFCSLMQHLSNDTEHTMSNLDNRIRTGHQHARPMAKYWTNFTNSDVTRLHWHRKWDNLLNTSIYWCEHNFN